MADIIIKNGTVITVDGERRVIENGAVAITGDRIVAVGKTEDVLAAHQAPEVIDATHKVIMPGLIDGHAHAGHALIKTMGGGNSEQWYDACHKAYTVASTPEFWYAESRLAALERLRFGVTTGVSLLGGGATVLRTDDPVYGGAHCRGVAEVGTRSFVAVGPTFPPQPRTYARIDENGVAHEYPVGYEQQFETCKQLVAEWHGKHGKRINIAMIYPVLRPERLRALSEADLALARKQVVEIADFARENGLVFTQDGHGKDSVTYAKELGILGPNALLSHSTDLTEEEIRIVAETGAHIAHNPSAIGSIKGRCPVPELLDAGANVCIGSDATAPDRTGDMFRHMQQCMHYHRTHFKDPDLLPPGRVLEMCTIDAARALGMEDEIGSVEVGKKADIVIVNMRRPHLYPFNMEASRVIYFANGNDVETVIVDGRVALADGKAQFVDEDEVLDQAQRETELMLDRTGFHHMLAEPPMFWRHTRFPSEVTG